MTVFSYFKGFTALSSNNSNLKYNTQKMNCMYFYNTLRPIVAKQNVSNGCLLLKILPLLLEICECL